MRQLDDSTLITTPLGEFYVADLRDVASRWHSGQGSALYAFVSTGTVVDGLAGEASQCARSCALQDWDEGEVDDWPALEAIAQLEQSP